MNIRKFIINLCSSFALIAIVFLPCEVSGANLSMTDKVKDFNYLYTVFKNNYPYFNVNERENNINWLSLKENFITEVRSTKNDTEYYETLQKILKLLNNGHADVLDTNEYLYCKSIYGDPSNIQLIGDAWVKQLDNQAAIQRYSKSYSDVSTPPSKSSNIYFPSNIVTEMLDYGKIAYLSVHTFLSPFIKNDMPVIQSFFNQIQNCKALIIDIRGNGGGDSRYWSDYLVPMLINKNLSDVTYSLYRGGTFVEQFVKSSEKTGYAGFNSIDDLPKSVVKNSPPETKTDFKYYSKEILQISPQNSVRFSGKIYLLIDQGVFSSSEGFAVFAKDTGFATLVGSPTEGDGIGSVDPALCVLPYSGFVVRFPLDMGLTSTGICDFEYKTKPDISVSAVENTKGDPVINTIISRVNKYNQ